MGWRSTGFFLGLLEVFDSQGGSIQVKEVNGQAFIVFTPGAARHLSGFPQIFASAINPGAANEAEVLSLESGSAGGHSQMSYVMTSDAADGSLEGTHRWFAGNTVVLAADATGVIVGGTTLFKLPTGDTTGATDRGVINASVSTGGNLILTPGTHYIDQTITASGTGAGLTFMPGASLKLGSSWAGPDSSGCMIHVSADSVRITDANLNGPGAASVGQCGGISVIGASHVRIKDPIFENMSWYGLVPQASVAGVPCVDFMVTNPIFRDCAAGIRLLSNSVASNHGEYFATNVQMQQMGSVLGFGADLDAFLIQDIEDILIDAVNIGVVAGTGSGIHDTGASDSILIGFVDIGTPSAAGSGPPILVDTTATSSPGFLYIGGGVVQGGSQGVSAVVGPGGVANTALLMISGVRSHQAWGSGWQLQSNVVALLNACMAEASNQSGAASTYDYDFSGLTSAAVVEANACIARTPVSGGPATVAAAMAVTSQVYVDNCKLLGTGTTPSNALSGTPRWIRGTAPVNPRGSITTPVITVGSFIPPASQYDMIVVFTSLGGMTDFQIGGTSLGVLPVAGAPIFVGARTLLTVVSSGTAPTWKWFANLWRLL